MFLFCPWGKNTVMEKFWLCCLCCHPPQVVEMWVSKIDCPWMVEQMFSLWSSYLGTSWWGQKVGKGNKCQIFTLDLFSLHQVVLLRACLEKWPGRTKFRFPQEQFNIYPRPRPVRQDECWFRRLLHRSARCSRCVTVIDHTDVQEWRRQQLMFSSLNLPKRGNELLAGLFMIYRTILVRFRKLLFTYAAVFPATSSRLPYLQIPPLWDE